MHKFRRLAATVAATALLTLAGLAAATTAVSAGTGGSCSARGEFPWCGATGEIESPQTITVTVTTSDPDQFAAVYWSVICGLGLFTSGNFHEMTPVTRTLEMPIQQPKSCKVIAYGEFITEATSVASLLSTSLSPHLR